MESATQIAELKKEVRLVWWHAMKNCQVDTQKEQTAKLQLVRKHGFVARLEHSQAVEQLTAQVLLYSHLSKLP